MLEPLKMQVKDRVERTALGLVGGVLMVVGLAFFTVAAWLAIRLSADALTAAMIIGGGYFGLGLILLGIAKFRRPRVEVPRQAGIQAGGASALAPGLVAAFMEGFGAGVTARRH